MDDSTLKEFIKQYIAASGNQVYFTWQGGEPTLAGLDFFRKVIHYQQRYAGQKRIFNALQTNGISFITNNPLVMFITVLGCSLLCSIIIEFIKSKIHI